MADIPEEAMDALVYNYLQNKDVNIAKAFKDTTNAVSKPLNFIICYAPFLRRRVIEIHHVGVWQHVGWWQPWRTNLCFDLLFFSLPWWKDPLPLKKYLTISKSKSKLNVVMSQYCSNTNVSHSRTSPTKRRISLENGTPAKKLKMQDSASESGEKENLNVMNHWQ